MESYQAVLVANGPRAKGFTLTPECLQEYQARTGRSYILSRLDIPFTRVYGEQTTELNLRIDPVLLDIYREKGSEWVSHNTLGIKLIPSMFVEYIDIFTVGGYESVLLDASKILETHVQGFLTQYAQSSHKERCVEMFAEQYKEIQTHLALLPTCTERSIQLEDEWQRARESRVRSSTEQAVIPTELAAELEVAHPIELGPWVTVRKPRKGGGHRQEHKRQEGSSRDTSVSHFPKSRFYLSDSDTE